MLFSCRFNSTMSGRSFQHLYKVSRTVFPRQERYRARDNPSSFRSHYSTGSRSSSSSGDRYRDRARERHESRAGKHDERRDYTKSNSRHSQPKKKSLKDTLDGILDHEKHHVVQIYRDSSGEVKEVAWCPGYIGEGARCPGGTATLHHTCRVCRKLCLHLLGEPFTSDRRCLNCDENGWDIERIPKWYYHAEKCRYCK